MKKADLYEKQKNKKVKCLACSQKCLISKGNKGICGVRKNFDGELYSLVYGKPISVSVDPIEKKPLFHFLPKTRVLSLGTVGCNFHCSWCQNFDISQMPKSQEGKIIGEDVSPEQIVDMALKNNCKSIAYTYNEPIIFVEYVKDIAKLAKKKGLKNILVTNGYLSKESFDYLNKEELVDAMNVDLKSFKDEVYKKYCGATKGVRPVLDTIERANNAGIHLEITTLLIPDLNDSDKELEKIAKFIYDLDKKGDIPLHISRFFPMYKFSNKKPTEIKTLKKAEEIGKRYLKNVHLGNI